MPVCIPAFTKTHIRKTLKMIEGSNIDHQRETVDRLRLADKNHLFSFVVEKMTQLVCYEWIFLFYAN